MKKKYNTSGPMKKYAYKGEIKSLTAWARELDIPYSTLRNRIDRGWSFVAAVETPIQRREQEKEDPEKKKLCVREICEKCKNNGITRSSRTLICGYILIYGKRRPCYAGECIEKGVFELMKGKRPPKQISIGRRSV